jgi:hypothetical protein
LRTDAAVSESSETRTIAAFRRPPTDDLDPFTAPRTRLSVRYSAATLPLLL